MGKRGEETNTFSFLQSHIFFPLKPKLDLLFGSRSRRGQRKSQCISISCPVSSPMSVELNLGWPSSVPTEVCLAEKGKEFALEDSHLQRSAHKLSVCPLYPLSVLQWREQDKEYSLSHQKIKNLVCAAGSRLCLLGQCESWL